MNVKIRFKTNEQKIRILSTRHAKYTNKQTETVNEIISNTRAYRIQMREYTGKKWQKNNRTAIYYTHATLHADDAGRKRIEKKKIGRNLSILSDCTVAKWTYLLLIEPFCHVCWHGRWKRICSGVRAMSVTKVKTNRKNSMYMHIYI